MMIEKCTCCNKVEVPYPGCPLGEICSNALKNIALSQDDSPIKTKLRIETILKKHKCWSFDLEIELLKHLEKRIALERVNVDTWISVEDELPKIQERVLCWVECEKCRKGERHRHKAVATGFPKHGCYIDSLINFKIERVAGLNKVVKCTPFWSVSSYFTPNITHWMPLPTLQI